MFTLLNFCSLQMGDHFFIQPNFKDASRSQLQNHTCASFFHNSTASLTMNEVDPIVHSEPLTQVVKQMQIQLNEFLISMASKLYDIMRLPKVILPEEPNPSASVLSALQQQQGFTPHEALLSILWSFTRCAGCVPESTSEVPATPSRQRMRHLLHLLRKGTQRPPMLQQGHGGAYPLQTQKGQYPHIFQRIKLNLPLLV
ncbi:hypothetical protein ANCCAN_22774 [Ancylostoma caninum]|uniref:Uncharacterized protein n=1 Tax=Ancylostoma caninum TaxID=29170 RepID=A0A368FKB1_ANCCA|nr:hypothetical protein ANCCAN_22774 [Ancylostoma caninum]